MPVASCKSLQSTVHHDARGDLLALEHPKEVPFPIARTFVVTQMRAGVARGGHAHFTCHELLVCLHGRIRIRASDPNGHVDVELLADGTSFHLTPLTWIDILPATDDAILMVLCSHPYETEDYLHEREFFTQAFHEAFQ